MITVKNVQKKTKINVKNVEKVSVLHQKMILHVFNNVMKVN